MFEAAALPSVGGFRLVDITSGLGRPHALLQPRGGAAVVVRRGDYMAQEQLKVIAIAPDGVKLERAMVAQTAKQVRVGLGQQLKP